MNAVLRKEIIETQTYVINDVLLQRKLLRDDDRKPRDTIRSWRSDYVVTPSVHRELLNTYRL